MPGNIWDKPAIPHALDDEFESTTLDPSWDYGGSLDFVTPIDPYAIVGGDPRVELHTNGRPSWLTFQKGLQLSKAYTLPTNCLMWTRWAPRIDQGKVDGEYFCGMYFTASSGGVPDSGNQVRLFLRGFQASGSIVFDKSELGGFPQVTEIGETSTRGMSYEYICLHKLGSTFHAWAITSGGVRTYLNSTTFLGAGTLDRVAIIATGSGTNPGTPFHAIDFFRVVESATYLP